MSTETKTITIVTCDICGAVVSEEERYHPDKDWLKYTYNDQKKGRCILKFKPDVIEYKDGKKQQVGVDLCKNCLKTALDQMLRRITDFKVNISYPEDPKESFAAHMGH